MNRLNKIITETKELNLFKIAVDLNKFLKEEYGLTTSVEPNHTYIDIYLANLKHQEGIEINPNDDKIAKAILNQYNKLVVDKKALNVFPTEYGYTIILDDGAPEEKLAENVMYYYYYQEDEDRNQSKNNNMHTIRKKLKENREEEEKRLAELIGEEIDDEEAELDNIAGEVDKAADKGIRRDAARDIEQETDDITIATEPETLPKEAEIDAEDLSNTALDNRFIWFFSVFDEDANPIEELIESLDEAIDVLVNVEIADMLVAYPYIDPNPEDDAVDLVFADNPGPTIIYEGGV